MHTHHRETVVHNVPSSFSVQNNTEQMVQMGQDTDVGNSMLAVSFRPLFFITVIKMRILA